MSIFSRFENYSNTVQVLFFDAFKSLNLYITAVKFDLRPLIGLTEVMGTANIVLSRPTVAFGQSAPGSLFDLQI